MHLRLDHPELGEEAAGVRKVRPEWAVGPSKIRAFLGGDSTGAVLR
jgi:hypothetical protein